VDFRHLLHPVSMKRYLLICVCCLLDVSGVLANKIDQLKTDKEVADFIVSLDSIRFHSKYSPQFTILSDEAIWARSKDAAAVKATKWEKVDLNNDGRTDLVVLGLWYSLNPFVAIDLGNDKFKLIRLSYSSFNESEPAKIIRKNDGPFLLFYVQKRFPDPKQIFGRDSVVIDTLIYKFDAFIEYSPILATKKISAVTFTTNTCLGTCPKFSITVNNMGEADYFGDSFAKPSGKNHTALSKPDLKQLFDVINYIDFKKVKDHYAVPWTDSPTATLSIKFADGAIKNISDYGELGTWGLQKIYTMFFQFYKDQPWQPN